MSELSWKNRFESDELFTRKFQVIVTLSRLFGCHPHPIFSGDSPRTTKVAKLWSVMWIVVLTTTCGFALRDLIMSKDIFRSNTFNKIIVLLGFVVSPTMAVIRADKFDKAMAIIQEFDGAACYEKRRGIVENFVAVGLTAFTFAVVARICSLKITKNDIEPITLIWLLGVGVISLEVYKYCFVLAALHRRFVHLKRITSSDLKEKFRSNWDLSVILGKVDIKSSKGDYYQPLTVQTVFILNHKLADAVGNFNRYYDVQIVYWLAYFITDLIIVIYVLAKMPVEDIDVSHIARLAFAIYNPALICAVSHFTCKKANELGKLLFGYEAPTLATTVSSLENLEFGFWLFQQPLKITGLELFSVDLPLLLSMIEAASTYATFIFQMEN